MSVNLSLEINIFGAADTMSCTNQFVPDIKEIVSDLYWTMIVTSHLFQGLDMSKIGILNHFCFALVLYIYIICIYIYICSRLII